MTPVQTSAAIMVMLALALVCFERSLRRAPASVAVARRRMLGQNDTPDHGPTARMLERPVSLVEERIGTGLSIIDRSASDIVGQMTTAFLAVFFIVIAGTVAIGQFGPLPWSPFWVVASAVLATFAAWTVWRGVGVAIRRRREEVRRAAADFVQLVAVGLTTDQSVEEAIRFALDVGDGDAFDLIRSDMLNAPQRGLAAWEALRAVGEKYEVRELEEFASSVERQGLQGVSIGATVATMAVAMRERALDELERAADKANANLAGPTIGFVVATIAFLAYPLAERISDAFGG
jgi:Flp pilus assembly protein TadB